MNRQRTHDLINPTAAESQPVLSPARNCSAISIAHRAAVLIDGASYFAALDAVLRTAERSITIIGWDFDASIRLRLLIVRAYLTPDQQKQGLRQIGRAQACREIRHCSIGPTDKDRIGPFSALILGRDPAGGQWSIVAA